jgi:hypothetical protein
MLRKASFQKHEGRQGKTPTLGSMNQNTFFMVYFYTLSHDEIVMFWAAFVKCLVAHF